MNAPTLFEVPAPTAAASRPVLRPVAADPVRCDRPPALAEVDVEVVASSSGRGCRWVTVLAVLVVALVAAVASFDHQRVLAETAGEGWRAWLLPLSVDGLVVAATMTMLGRRRAGLAAGWLAWCSLVLGVAASLAANVAAAEPTAVGRMVAAWPPVALLLAVELLLRQGRR